MYSLEDLDGMSDDDLRRLRALADYTLLARTAIAKMNLEQLVKATDAARVLLATEIDTGVRDALLDAINRIDQECRARNAKDPQRIEGRLNINPGRFAVAGRSIDHG